MRFGLPRSASSSPVRLETRTRSSFAIPSDSSSDDEDYTSEEDTSTSGADDDFTPRKSRLGRSIAEQRHVEDTVASIRLRTRHHDLYEEWEKQTRRDAFKSARKEQAEVKLESEDAQSQAVDAARQAQIHAQQIAEVEAQLRSLTVQQTAEQSKFEQSWKVREKSLWERVEAGIKAEEDKERAKLEAERKVREEEERKRQEAQRRREEEVRQQEEIARQQKEAQEKQRQDQEQQKAAKDAQKRQAEEARLLKEQQEKAQEQQAQTMDERTKTEAEQRKTLGATTALDDWRIGRENLMRLKTENTRVVKADAQMKSAWGGLRRQVVRKFGQVTNDAESIARVSNEITQLAMPPGGLHPLILNSFYSSIAKAIMQQAETEVTAEKASAIPIARVAHRLLGTLDGFADIFFAKLVQRVGAWPVPTAPPPADYDGQQWKSDHERFGYRPSQSSDGMESPPQHVERVTGVMRVYFHILATPPGDKPISNRFFQPTRYWVWYARALSHPSMLASDVCASLIHAGLEIFGSDARKIWGKQWTKVLALIYDLVKNGLGDGKVFGGTSPEGVASRMRVQLEIDSIMGAGN